MGVHQNAEAAMREAVEAIKRVKQVWGAPGEHGYGTPEGDALFVLYSANASLLNALTPQPDAGLVLKAVQSILAAAGLSGMASAVTPGFKLRREGWARLLEVIAGRIRELTGDPDVDGEATQGLRELAAQHIEALEILDHVPAQALDEVAEFNPTAPYRSEKRSLSTKGGGLGLLGQRFQSDWMKDFPGLIVEVRFDPRRLDEGVYVYTVTGRLLGRAECRGRRRGSESLGQIGCA